MVLSEPKGWYSRGFLPHFDSPEIIQHVVFRTFGSLQAEILGNIPESLHLRSRFVDAQLDKARDGCLLNDPAVATIVQSTMLHFDGERYRLLAWCIMPNHVHAVFEQIAGWQLEAIVKSWKGVSTRLANNLKASHGPIWAADFYDRFIRNEIHLAKTLEYVESNPVNAGLVGRAADWPFSSATNRER